MNEFFNWFAKVPGLAKVGALLVLMASVYAVNYFVFEQQKVSDLEKLKAESKKLSVRLGENNAIAENMPRFKEEVNILRTQLRQALSLLPDQANVHILYRQLFVEAERSNIELVSFKPAGTNRRGFYSDLSLEVKIEGTYHRIAEFIDRVGKLDRIINVSNIVFSTSNMQKTGDVVLGVNCKVTTFMFGGG
ncbi:MAG: type 4a pilus biogenesis protein PilO [Bdellovibrionales bacterium]|nr:type 4a pilus biogenesis protein PilO [Bdellovibrionales bacterium]